MDHPEITPFIPATGDRLFDSDGRPVRIERNPMDRLPQGSGQLAIGELNASHDGASLEDVGGPDAVVRAVVESQFMSMKVHGEGLGLKSPTRILVTGGGSVNRAVTQVLADVMGAEVYAADTSDSAALGAAYRALHSRACT